MRCGLLKRVVSLITCLMLVLPNTVVAQEEDVFVIEDIRLEGLRRFSPGAVFSRLSVNIGDTVNSQATIDIIESLYDTGFFRSVDVLRDGNVLVIQVSENPTIAEVTVSGAEELSDNALEELLKSANISKAKVFDRNVVDQASRAIEAAYIERNFYEARVEAIVSPLPRNRVAVLFNVHEGEAAAIRSIRLVGNEVFSSWRLTRLMKLEARNAFNFWGSSYLFSQRKLDADIGRLQTFYLEEGYLNFEIESQVIEVSEDKKDINIILYLKEGERYIVSDIEIELADEAKPPAFELEETLRQYITQEIGDLYSGRDANDAVANMREELGKRGYFRARISFTPDINDETGEVKVVYTVDPMNIIYVRYIKIAGNEFTSDEVIRRELLQFERERYSGDKISRSRSRIRRLGYFDSVNITTLPVPDNPDEIDLIITVKEANTGEIRLGAGFNTDGGLTYNAGFSNDNIFGSGNDFSLDLKKTDGNLLANFALDEKYYTRDGVTRHTAMGYDEEKSSDDSSSYDIDGFRGEFGFDWPFTDDGVYNLYLAYRKIGVNSTKTLTPVYKEFTDKHGDDFQTLYLIGGFRYDTRDAASVPTEGHLITGRTEVTTPVLDLEYYYLDYLHKYYHQFDDFFLDPVFHFRLGASHGDSYGSGEYPFYRRVLLGGTNTLRGFSANSIGYALDSKNNAIGGKSRLYGSVESSFDANFFIFEEQQVFLVPFIDAGGVGKELDIGSFRASAGVELRWRSPIGPLRFSYIKDLKSKSTDNLDSFQFSISTF